MTDQLPLRDALINAGIALLNEGGMEALTLRRAAARAGVSHAAPAHHFDGLPGLLTAIAARAFETFADDTHTGREAAGTDPFARLLGTCTGYLTFAATHKGLFHLMFVSPQVKRDDPSVTPHSTRAYLILRAACLPFAPDGRTADTVLETAVWSLVHGYAALGFADPANHRHAFVPPPPFEQLLRELLKGRQNPLAPAPETR